MSDFSFYFNEVQDRVNDRVYILSNGGKMLAHLKKTFAAEKVGDEIDKFMDDEGDPNWELIAAYAVLMMMKEMSK